MGRAIASIPAGVFTFEDFMDDDGFDAVSIPIRVTITIDPQKPRAIVDLRDTADGVPGPINCPRAVACSAVYYCFACLLDAAVPLNDGCFSPIEVLTRPGSLIDAQYP